MCPAGATRVLYKMQKPAMSLKQFMLRSEVLKLYRGFFRIGKLLDDPPPDYSEPVEKGAKGMNPMRKEWNDWVRSEFRLRQNVATDEDATKALLAHGQRHLQEMERTILLATNTNKVVGPPPKVAQSPNRCSSKDAKDVHDNPPKSRTELESSQSPKSSDDTKS